MGLLLTLLPIPPAGAPWWTVTTRDNGGRTGHSPIRGSRRVPGNMARPMLGLPKGFMTDHQAYGNYDPIGGLAVISHRASEYATGRREHD